MDREISPIMYHAMTERALSRHLTKAIDPSRCTESSCPIVRERNRAYLAYTSKPHVSVR